MRAFLVILIILTLTFRALPIMAQDRNPDGIIDAPTITILGGLRMGNDTYSLWEGRPLFSSRGDLNGSLLMAEIIYPATKNLSLIFQFSRDWQKLEYPKTEASYRRETTLTGYNLIFGIRLFTK